MKRCVQTPSAIQWMMASAALAAPVLAHAHSEIGATSGFAQGVAHPVMGVDHLATMVAVGLWAAQRGGHAVWMVPLAFVAAMAVGGSFGALGASSAFVESANVASVLVLGVLICAAVRLPLVASSILVASFALFHGFAHGSELPPTLSAVPYGLGVVLATGLLQGCGVGIGLFAQRMAKPRLLRYAGGAITALGLSICLA